jgi:hypothetical protein
VLDETGLVTASESSFDGFLQGADVSLLILVVKELSTCESLICDITAGIAVVG